MDIRFNEQGIVPAIAVDAKSGRVLMLAYMNREALDQTLKTKRAVYYSRSRQELWRKGDTSGNVQEVISVFYDCDFDAVLLNVNQTGVACHTGEYSCFHNLVLGEVRHGFELFSMEEDAIKDRKLHPKEKSYTNYLFDSGIDKICKKVGEEATEIIIAAKNQDKSELAGEIADLLYHLQVLLISKDMSFADVLSVMEKRMLKQGNLKEKNTKGEL